MSSSTSNQPEYSSTPVQDAIHSAPREQLAGILSQLCVQDQNAMFFTATQLLGAEQGDAAVLSTILSSDQGTKNAPKRKATESPPGMVKCKRCEELFDITTPRSPESDECPYHPGKKYPNADAAVFDDHDERIHGRLEDFVDDPWYQEGFVWDCCEQNMAFEGCELTSHVAEERDSKRGRE